MFPPYSPSNPLRLAMWSGPRNISTALLRSWGNRTDTAVVDEPLYAHYLATTGKDHPGRDLIISQGEPDWRKVVAALTGPVPHRQTIYYQKHMSHHLLPDMDREWFGLLKHCFLIRHPREVLTSYIKVVENPTLEDTGYPQLTEIFKWVKAHTGEVPIVIESVDVLDNPRRLLGLVCERLGIPFQDAMLKWPAGRRATDGVWAPFWYAEVEKSTEFRPFRPKSDLLPEELRELYSECLQHYEQLHAHRLT